MSCESLCESLRQMAERSQETVSGGSPLRSAAGMQVQPFPKHSVGFTAKYFHCSAIWQYQFAASLVLNLSSMRDSSPSQHGKGRELVFSSTEPTFSFRVTARQTRQVASTRHQHPKFHFSIVPSFLDLYMLSSSLL